MLTETQKDLFELLKEIYDICTRHDIDYYLAGGSMIGAVRHGGFLPWDNDADIHMTKEAAEKFASLSSEFLPGRIVVSKDTHRDHPAVHWRYMNTNKTTMLKSFFSEVPQGQFVDIFILNPITNDVSRLSGNITSIRNGSLIIIRSIRSVTIPFSMIIRS